MNTPRQSIHPLLPLYRDPSLIIALSLGSLVQLALECVSGTRQPILITMLIGAILARGYSKPLPKKTVSSDCLSSLSNDTALRRSRPQQPIVGQVVEGDSP